MRSTCFGVSLIGWLLLHGCSIDETPATANGATVTDTPRSPAAGSGGSQAVASMSVPSGGKGSTPNASGGSGTQAGAAAGPKAGAPGLNAPTAGGGAGSTSMSGAATSAAGAGMGGAAASGTGGSGGAEASSDGTLPVADVWKKGPWEIAELPMAGPNNNGTVIYPKDLGKDGVKHPISVWGNGAGATGPESYRMVTEYIASHGFPVYITYQSTDAGTELLDGITWMIAENSRSGSVFEGKLDTAKVASMGHSMGGLASFAIAKDPRLTTTLHLSGGTFNHDQVNNLHAPAAFICGEDGGDGIIEGDLATANCKIDFMNSKVPTFFAEGIGLSHATGYNFMQPLVCGWLRWKLTDDTNIKKMFVGPDCELCKDTMKWKVMQKDLD